MLCLSFRKGERVQIGSDVIVEVKRASSRITLGIEAPPEVKILRTSIARLDGCRVLPHTDFLLSTLQRQLEDALHQLGEIRAYVEDDGDGTECEHWMAVDFDEESCRFLADVTGILRRALMELERGSEP